MYAVTEIKGFQYRVEKGETLRVPKFDIEVGKKITIPEVMLVADDSGVKVGTPYVDGAEVSATVTGHDRYDKVTVFKKKRRKDYSVKKGHRQDYTEIVIDEIKIGAAKTKAAAKPAEEKPAPAVETEVKTTEAVKAETPEKVVETPEKKAAPKAKKPAVKKTEAAKKPAAKEEKKETKE